MYKYAASVHAAEMLNGKRRNVKLHRVFPRPRCAERATVLFYCSSNNVNRTCLISTVVVDGTARRPGCASLCLALILPIGAIIISCSGWMAVKLEATPPVP